MFRSRYGMERVKIFYPAFACSSGFHFRSLAYKCLPVVRGFGGYTYSKNWMIKFAWTVVYKKWVGI